MNSRRRHLRVYCIGVVFVLVTGGLWARLIHVQYFQRHHYRVVADGQKVVSQTIDPARGGIFDRYGRPLALSIRRCSVSLHPGDVRNPGQVAAAVSRHLGLSRASVARQIRSGKNFVWLKRQCFLSESSRRELSGLEGVAVHREAGRLYPYGKVGAKLVGFVGVDNRGMAGAEAAFEEQLRGTPGSEKILRNGKYRASRYYRFVEKKPTDGKHVFLTIDVVTQELAETELEKAVEEYGASSGSMIIMQAKTGEILALAEYPWPQTRTASDLDDALWTIRSISHVYEPGSTFKLVTAAALLDAHKVTPVDSFDAEKGKGTIGSFTIADTHPHDQITFADAFVYSSNIVMYKAAGLIAAGDFFDYIRLFGFGEKTGIALLGESAGRISEVKDWSLRTKGTIAFGQEIAVTPLQMIGAYGVVSNDGVLVVPRIVRGLADPGSGEIEKYKSVKVRRVISRATARTLRDFCRRTVTEGTGTGAAVEFMEVSGKTGTAQVASPSGGYVPGKYVSSFIGFAPSQDPEIVCLIMLNEPRYSARYGGVSCAPVFARVCRAAANATPLWDDVLAAREIRAVPAGSGRYRAPNFLRMERAAALERARKIGSNVLCQGENGRVVAQEPGPGVAMDENDVIRLYISGGEDKKTRTTPDLLGLPLREAKLALARKGFTCAPVGSGIVASQKPAPGQATAYQTVKLYCSDGTWGSAGGSR